MRTTIQRKIDRIIDAITEGLRTPDMKEKLEALTAQKAARAGKPRGQQPGPLPSMHPNLAEVYRTKVAGLQEAITASPDNAGVLERLRDLIDRVDLALNAPITRSQWRNVRRRIGHGFCPSSRRHLHCALRFCGFG
jgi:hypothetical protein